MRIIRVLCAISMYLEAFNQIPKMSYFRKKLGGGRRISTDSISTRLEKVDLDLKTIKKRFGFKKVEHVMSGTRRTSNKKGQSGDFGDGFDEFSRSRSGNHNFVQNVGRVNEFGKFTQEGGETTSNKINHGRSPSQGQEFSQGVAVATNREVSDVAEGGSDLRRSNRIKFSKSAKDPDFDYSGSSSAVSSSRKKIIRGSSSKSAPASHVGCSSVVRGPSEVFRRGVRGPREVSDCNVETAAKTIPSSIPEFIPASSSEFYVDESSGPVDEEWWGDFKTISSPDAEESGSFLSRPWGSSQHSPEQLLCGSSSSADDIQPLHCSPSVFFSEERPDFCLQECLQGLNSVGAAGCEHHFCDSGRDLPYSGESGSSSSSFIQFRTPDRNAFAVREGPPEESCLIQSGLLSSASESQSRRVPNRSAASSSRNCRVLNPKSPERKTRGGSKRNSEGSCVADSRRSGLNDFSPLLSVDCSNNNSSITNGFDNSISCSSSNNIRPLSVDKVLGFLSSNVGSFRSVKYLHKHLQQPLSLAISNILDSIKRKPNDLNPYLEFFLFPHSVLSTMKAADLRKIRKRNRSAAQRNFNVERLNRWNTDKHSLMWETIDQCARQLHTSSEAPRPKHSFSSNLKRAERLVREDGQYGKAVKTLHSNGIAPVNAETLKALVDKHPVSALPNSDIFPPLDIDSSEILSVSAKNIIFQLQTFSKGTACGRSGWRVAHFLELCQFQHFMDGFLPLVNSLLAGTVPPSIAHLLVSGNLVPLKKKDGNVRPIVVGEVLRRLVSKLCASKAYEVSAEYLQPLQVGVGVSGGVETLLHAFNRIIRSDLVVPEKTTLALIDFSNAFNEVNRHSMLKMVRDKLPSLFPWVYFCYSIAAPLFVESEIIHATTGVQQGDPLGPLLFALVLQPHLLHIKESFNVTLGAYLDDVTVCGSQESILFYGSRPVARFQPVL